MYILKDMQAKPDNLPNKYTPESTCQGESRAHKRRIITADVKGPK